MGMFNSEYLTNLKRFIRDCTVNFTVIVDISKFFYSPSKGQFKDLIHIEPICLHRLLRGIHEIVIQIY